MSLGEGIAQLAPGEANAGVWIAVIGAANSDPSSILDDAQKQWEAWSPGCTIAAREAPLKKNISPLTFLGKAGTRRQGSADRLATALDALKLWDDRKTPLSELTDRQMAAVSLLPPLAEPARAVFIDGWLDELDFISLPGVISLLKTKRTEGAFVCCSTNRPDIAEQADKLVVLIGDNVAFEGSPSELIEHVGPVKIEIATDRPHSARTVVEPFAVSIEQTEEGLIVTPEPGQELAAKLLLAGYGDFKFLLLRRPTFSDALSRLTARPRYDRFR